MIELFIENQIIIDAPAARVWTILTEPVYTRQYMFGCAAISDWQPGSELLWVGNFDGKEMVAVKGKVVAIDPEKMLEYTVLDPNNPLTPDIPENYLHVTYQLKNEDGKIILSVRQGDFSQVAEGAKRYKEIYNEGIGWQPFLEQIKQLAESTD